MKQLFVFLFSLCVVQLVSAQSIIEANKVTVNKTLTVNQVPITIIDKDTSFSRNSDSALATQKAIRAFSENRMSSMIIGGYFDTVTRLLVLKLFKGDSITMIIPKGTLSGPAGIAVITPSRTGNIVTLMGDNGNTASFNVGDKDSTLYAGKADSARVLFLVAAKVNYTDSTVIYATPTQVQALIASGISTRVRTMDSTTVFATPNQVQTLIASAIANRVKYGDSTVTFTTPTQVQSIVNTAVASKVQVVRAGPADSATKSPTMIQVFQTVGGVTTLIFQHADATHDGGLTARYWSALDSLINGLLFGNISVGNAAVDGQSLGYAKPDSTGIVLKEAKSSNTIDTVARDTAHISFNLHGVTSAPAANQYYGTGTTAGYAGLGWQNAPTSTGGGTTITPHVVRIKWGYNQDLSIPGFRTSDSIYKDTAFMGWRWKAYIVGKTKQEVLDSTDWAYSAARDPYTPWMNYSSRGDSIFRFHNFGNLGLSDSTFSVILERGVQGYPVDKTDTGTSSLVMDSLRFELDTTVAQSGWAHLTGDASAFSGRIIADTGGNHHTITISSIGYSSWYPGSYSATPNTNTFPNQGTTSGTVWPYATTVMQEQWFQWSIAINTSNPQLRIGGLLPGHDYKLQLTGSIGYSGFTAIGDYAVKGVSLLATQQLDNHPSGPNTASSITFPGSGDGTTKLTADSSGNIYISFGCHSGSSVASICGGILTQID